jgi:glycogen debranching enzyme
MNTSRSLLTSVAVLAFSSLVAAAQIAPFPMTDSGLVISRPVQPMQPFTVAGERGVLVGTQDGQFESWILPVKLISHLTLEVNVEGYSVPIAVNPQAANIEVRPDRTTITYSHIGFTIRQIMFSPDGAAAENRPSTGPVVLFQIDADHPLDLTFRFTPEMRWMWPKRNDGIPGPDWVAGSREGLPGGYYTLHMDYPDLGGAIAIPTATPGIAAPYQERPQEHEMELHLHYDPKRDGRGAEAKLFPLLMAVGTTRETATNEALGRALKALNDSIPAAYKSHAERYAKLAQETTSIETPDKALNDAFKWGVVSIEQLKAHEFVSNQTALVAGYYASGDSARPGFGWFFGRDALYTLYAVNGFGDFALTRAELEFLIARQRADGKIMHEYSQTAGDPVVDWKSFPYMYAAADATPLFLMAVRDYLRASGDVEFVKAHRDTIEKAWAFETAASSDTDHDGIYDNSQGTGWVESWPHDAMPHQEVYLALLDEQASRAYGDLEGALGNKAGLVAGALRQGDIETKIEQEYYDKEKGCYAFSHNLANDPNGATDRASTVYPAIAWWDWSAPNPLLVHDAECLKQFASPAIATDWGLRDVAITEPFYDGMSYHQGSVWPLFTGWGALAEYRGGQPLAGEQMLMQNVDLTWAQDPGAVTELLSGDFYVPFGRSTSHQLWSSAMVITPTLRGLFGITVDAATKTITVNPHLPAGWHRATIHNLRVGDKLVRIDISRNKGELSVQAYGEDYKPAGVKLRSDLPGATLQAHPVLSDSEVLIPLPPIELTLPEHTLPVPGSRPAQMKIISTAYAAHRMTLIVEGQPDSDSEFVLHRNQLLMPRETIVNLKEHPDASSEISFIDTALRQADIAMRFQIHFPKGQGWQTLEFTLTW